MSSWENGEVIWAAAAVPARAAAGVGLLGWMARGLSTGRAGRGCVALWIVEHAMEQL